MLLLLVYFSLRRLLHALAPQIALAWNAKPSCWSVDISPRSGTVALIAKPPHRADSRS
jgi:hypothetical protein